ncbi:MAG: hypothetical protein QM791_20090 [Ferruginibacter sp.]
MLVQKEVKSVLNKHKQRDSWFLDDYSVNPYEGCACNCLYCYIRGSKYGENMEEKLAVKTNVLQVLEKQLRNRAKKNQHGIVAVGSGTDAYMHHEANYKLTQGVLELLLKYRFPVFISTKSTLITRDIELLKAIDKTAILPGDLKDKLGSGVILSVSVSTMDENISTTLEPAAAKPAERLAIVTHLKKEGFLVGVNAIPVLPYISDTEDALNKIIAASKSAGADYILVGGLTLFGNEPSDSKTLYYNFLKRYDPALIEKYNGLYGNNFYTPRSYQNLLKERAEKIATKYQLRTSILKT